MLTRPASIIALLLMLLITGCSSGGTMNIKQKMSQTITPGKSVALSVEIIPAYRTNADCKEMQSRLRESLLSELLSEGIFNSVVPAPEPADYTLNVTITDARIVSTAARGFGPAAGPNFADLDVRLLGQGNELITYYTVTGASAAYHLSKNNRPDDAIREAVTNVVKGLRQ